MTELMSKGQDFPVGSWERPDAGGIVRRGEAAEFVRAYIGWNGEAPTCFVGFSGAGLGCESKATMEVYGLGFCQAHGEQAAASAFEEMYHDLELRYCYRNKGFATNAEHAFCAAMDSLPSYEEGFDQALRAAFPLTNETRERILEDTLLYFQTPEDERYGYGAPYDTHRSDCLVICRHMRLAFEERQTWLVELLEQHREDSAAQAAWALAIQEELEPH